MPRRLPVYPDELLAHVEMLARALRLMRVPVDAPRASRRGCCVLLLPLLVSLPLAPFGMPFGRQHEREEGVHEAAGLRALRLAGRHEELQVGLRVQGWQEEGEARDRAEEEVVVPVARAHTHRVKAHATV